jgi:hypothetical protein
MYPRSALSLVKRSIEHLHARVTCVYELQTAREELRHAQNYMADPRMKDEDDVRRIAVKFRQVSDLMVLREQLDSAIGDPRDEYVCLSSPLCSLPADSVDLIDPNPNPLTIRHRHILNPGILNEWSARVAKSGSLSHGWSRNASKQLTNRGRCSLN